MKKGILAIFTAAIILHSASVWADESTKETTRNEYLFETMTVTAQKQEENIQEVPAGITLLNAAALEDRKIENTFDVAERVPNLMFYEQSSGFVVPSMRGIASTPEAYSGAVGIYVDGVPLLNGSGLEADTLDVERVEVLRGPQGTLYGKGAEVGVLNIITKKPGKSFKSMATLEAGKYLSGEGGRQLDTKMTLLASGPLVDDSLSLGVSGILRREDGFMKNTYDDSTIDDYLHKTAKGHLLWTPTDSFEASLIYTYMNKAGDGDRMSFSPKGVRDMNAMLAMIGAGVQLPNPENRRLNMDMDDMQHGWTTHMAALKLEYDINDTFSLQSVTSYWNNGRYDDWDSDFSPHHIMHGTSDFALTRISEELRLNFTTPTFKGVVGAYADHDTSSVKSDITSAYPMFARQVDGEVNGHSMAIYGNVTYAITEKWSLNGGVRWGRDVREMANHVTGTSGKKGWNEISPRLALQYQVVPEAMLYASVSKGSRSGGYTVVSPKSYKPENIWSYETGAKTMLFDNKLMLNACVYYMSIDDMQVKEQIDTMNVLYTNAAKATGKGVEVEALAQLTDELTFDASFGYNSVTFDEFEDALGDYKGKHNIYAPEYSFSAGLQYRSKSGFYARGEVVGYGEMFFDKANTYSRDPYALINARIGYETEHFDIYLYGKNILNEQYDSVGDYDGAYTFYSKPGQVGTQIVVRF